MKIKKIYIRDWLSLKPYDKQTKTDSYFLNLSNKVKIALLSKEFLLPLYIQDNEVNILACLIASYFEDIISDTNIFNTFIEFHSEMYEKRLPFYNTKDDYYEKEINQQDISFLIWYFVNTIQEEEFLNPDNKLLKNLAANVMEILDEEYQYAPENTELKKYYELDENETDFYKVRSLIDTILFETYLFYPDTGIRLRLKEEELVKNHRDQNILMYLRDCRDSILHSSYTRILNIKGKEWASGVLGKRNPISTFINQISDKINGYFFYKGQDEYNVFIEHIASGKKFNMVKKSIDHAEHLKNHETILFLGIVCWKNEWWFSGTSMQIPFDPDLVLDEKNSNVSRQSVAFIDQKNPMVIESLKTQHEIFVEFTQRHQIVFMELDEITVFTNRFMAFYNKSLKLTKKEIAQSISNAKKEGYFGGVEKERGNFSSNNATGLVFFNPNSGMEIAFGINSAFPLPHNSFFNPEESDIDVQFLLRSNEISKELAMYCIEKCAPDLPYFKEGPGKLYLNDIDFLLRFWKNQNYHSKPEITLIGNK